MFTGLVQQVGTLVERRPGARQQTLVVQAALKAGDRILGASVAIAGVCLTVTAATAERFEVVAAFETLDKTTLGDKSLGDRLNLEPALRVGDPLGGHLVSGHVDGVGSVRSIEAQGQAKQFWFDLPETLARYVAPKGSITIDGTSLTVNDVDARGFSVGLIPHTLEVTTLGALAVGSRVNLEVDLLARYVARLLEHGQSSDADTAAKDASLRGALAAGGWGVDA